MYTNIKHRTSNKLIHETDRHDVSVNVNTAVAEIPHSLESGNVQVRVLK